MTRRKSPAKTWASFWVWSELAAKLVNPFDESTPISGLGEGVAQL